MNDHITDFLKYYIALKNPPEYAVFLKGGWGSGKTWFVNGFIEEMEGVGIKFLRVSLYGMSTFGEIEEEFFQQLHPVLASKGMRLAGKVLKGFLKTTIKVDLDGDGNADGSVSSQVPDIKLPDYLNNADNRILVFDDLERCAIPIDNLLGYINHFVENKGMKVIVVGNETELLKAKGEEEVSRFALVKEKLIGKSFEVRSDFEAAYGAFVGDLESEAVKKLLEGKQALVEQVYKQAAYGNLRHLRQVTFDFERFRKHLPTEVFGKPDLVDHVMAMFFAIGFELKKGGLKENEIDAFLGGRTITQRIADGNSEATPQEILRGKYSFPQRSPIRTIELKAFFTYGLADETAIAASIRDSPYFHDENTPAWKKLNDMYSLSDEQFEENVAVVRGKLENGSYDDKHAVVHTTLKLMEFSRFKLIGLSPEEVAALGRQNLQGLKEAGLLKLRPTEKFPALSYFSNRRMRGFQDLEKEFLETAKEMAEEVAEMSKSELAQVLLKQMVEEPDEFRAAIQVNNDRRNLYYDTPILHHIDQSDFCDAFFQLSNQDKTELAHAIRNRYELLELAEKLVEELDWLRWVKQVLLDRLPDPEEVFKLGETIARDWLVPELVKAIVMLERIKESRERVEEALSSLVPEEGDSEEE